jgi:ribosome assembly protein 4
MTGHQKGVNFVLYSPDGRLIVSASFDKSAKLWDGKTGAYGIVLHPRIPWSVSYH